MSLHDAWSILRSQREALLLADIRHPNIVQLIKVGLRPELCIVTELLMCSLHAMIHLGAGGALRERLLKPEAVTQARANYSYQHKHQCLRHSRKMQICMHIARGMNYLHSLEKIVIHRNLNSKNLLLDDGGKVMHTALSNMTPLCHVACFVLN